MARNRQLILICASVLALCSAFSHLAARVLKLRTEPISLLAFGETNHPPAATIGGSSLTFYGIEWNTLAQQLDAGMIGWGVPAGSVHELEILQRRPPPPGKWTFLGVSLFDLNENYISDFRADIVPIGEAVSSLRESHSSWAHNKRVLAQYPMKYIRAVFPTAGRSMAVMVGIRTELRALLRRQSDSGDETERPTLSSQSNPHQEGIDHWSPARRLRNLGAMRSQTSGALVYGGQKWHSLLRYVERGSQSGKVILVVIPESPTYRAELVAPNALQQFEARLTELQKRFPDLVCIRLDQVPELNSDALYWDLVHLNAPGQEIATQVLLARLKEAGIHR